MKRSTIQRCFTDFEGRPPFESELDFLDNFIKSRENLASSHSATSVSTNDIEVAKTLKDLMKKRSILYPDYPRPLTLKEIFLMSGEVTSLGKTQSFSMADHKLFSEESNFLARLNSILLGFTPKACQNGVCVAQNQYLPIKTKEIRPAKRYAVTIAYSSNEDGLLSFARKIAVSRLSVNSFASKGSEVFCKICEKSRSLSVNAYLLPGLTPQSLFDNSFGDNAIVVFSKPKCAKRIVSLAKKHGLETCSAITISKDNYFKLSTGRFGIFSFKSVILRGAMGALAKDIKIPDQFPAKEIPLAKEICSFPESRECVYITDIILDSELAFSQSISAVISPLVAAAYDRLNTQNSEFSISINASLSKVGDESFAALLGLYRAISELGIAVENPHVSMTDGESNITVALRAHSFKEKAGFVATISQEEMLKMLIDGKDIPDFQAVRRLINGKNT